jgi:hypothetical protein
MGALTKGPRPLSREEFSPERIVLLHRAYRTFLSSEGLDRDDRAVTMGGGKAQSTCWIKQGIDTTKGERST